MCEWCQSQRTLCFQLPCHIFPGTIIYFNANQCNNVCKLTFCSYQCRRLNPCLSSGNVVLQEKLGCPIIPMEISPKYLVDTRYKDILLRILTPPPPDWHWSLTHSVPHCMSPFYAAVSIHTHSTVSCVFALFRSALRFAV